MFNNDLFWSGNFYEPGTYYVVIDQTGSVTGSYMLTVSGSGVSSIATPAAASATPAATPAATKTAPAAAAPATATAVAPTAAVTTTKTTTTTTTAPAPTTAAKPAATPAPSQNTGTGPDSAMALPMQQWAPLQMGQRVWYAFHYAGDGSQVDVRLSAYPDSSIASFAVWTPSNLRSWQQGNAENPIGRGSVNSMFNNDLFWSGNFYEPGTYYVVIDQTGSVTGSYMLTVSGSGVSPVGK
jgi:hypothetical protein